jgi:dGTP triphosphohydrolase
VAGLIHDLGHGPYSHMFEHVLHRALKKTGGELEWTHEDGGLELFKVRKTPSWPEVGSTSAFYSSCPTGMHGPTCIVWANLTPFSLKHLLADNGLGNLEEFGLTEKAAPPSAHTCLNTPCNTLCSGWDTRAEVRLTRPCPL